MAEEAFRRKFTAGEEGGEFGARGFEAADERDDAPAEHRPGDQRGNRDAQAGDGRDQGLPDAAGELHWPRLGHVERHRVEGAQHADHGPQQPDHRGDGREVQEVVDERLHAAGLADAFALHDFADGLRAGIGVLGREVEPCGDDRPEGGGPVRAVRAGLARASGAEQFAQAEALGVRR